MALPVTIDVNYGASQGQGYHGPFKSSAGAFYSIGEHLSGGNAQLGAWKATDPTSSFAEQDTANRPTIGGSDLVYSLWEFSKGDSIHCANQEHNTAGPNFQLWYTRFDMSSDAWADIDGGGDRDIVVDSAPAGDDGPNASACSIAVEETGSDIVIAYQGEADKDMGTLYATIDYAKSTDGGSNWSAANSVAGTANGVAHYTGPVIVRGSSDRMHIFFMDGDGALAYQRTLRSDDTLQSFPGSAFMSSVIAYYPFSKGVAFTSGSNLKIRITLGDVSGNVSDAGFVNSIDSPAVSVVASDFSDNAARYSGSTPVGFAVNGDVQHVLYSGGGAGGIDRDLYNTNSGSDDDTFITDSEILNAVTINHVSANVYDRSGAKLAYIYDDGGTVKYNEVDLGGGVSAAAGSISITTSVSGDGAATGAGDGSISSTVSVSGAASSTAAGDGSVTITTSISGEGSSILSGDGSVNITASVSGVGAAVYAVDGSISITSSISGQATSVGAAVGSSSITTDVSGVGESTAATVGSISATSSISGIGASIASCAGAISATSSVSGVGDSVTATAGDGSISITTSVSGIGASIASADGTISITTSISGDGASTAVTAGTIPITTSVSGAGASTVAAAGSIAVTSDVSGVGTSIAAAAGSISITTDVSGTGAAVYATDGSIAATSSVSGVGEATGAGDGSISVTVDVSGVGQALGTSAGTGTIAITTSVSGDGASTAATDGAISITSDVSGVGQGAVSADGSIAITSTVSGEGTGVIPSGGTIAITSTISGVVSSTAAGAGAVAILAAVAGAGASVSEIIGGVSAIVAVTGVGEADAETVGSISINVAVNGVGSIILPSTIPKLLKESSENVNVYISGENAATYTSEELPNTKISNRNH